MLRIYTCVSQEHDLRLVALAALVCFFASFTAVNLVSYATRDTRSTKWLWLAATSGVTGTGIWATHFIAMLAFNPGMPTSYDLTLTAASVLIAIVITGVGFAASALNQTLRFNLAIGALLIGAGIFAMHFTGMAGLRLPALIEYDPLLMTASLLIGVSLSGFALWLNSRGSEVRQQLAAAISLTLAICGLHFTAMGSVSLTPNPFIPIPEEGMPSEWLAIGVTITTLFILAAGFVSAFVDRRFALLAAREAARLRTTVTELEETKMRLEAASANLTKALEEAAAGSQAKSQFLAAMSHELRTPLNAVIGFSDVLVSSSYGPLNDKQQEYVTNIRDAGSHLLALVNDVLDLSKLDAGRMVLDQSRVDLEETISAAVTMVSARAKSAGVRIECEFQVAPVVCGDERRLRQVLLNLLTNAIKFTPRGGWVRVTTAIENGLIAISVSDSGIGIAADDIPRCLERFVQIDNNLARNYEGTGLGLPLSRRLVELHGGSLKITSVVNQGTTVMVTLPVGVADLAAA